MSSNQAKTNAEERDEALLRDFNAKFGKNVRTIDVLRRLLAAPQVAPWYAEWRAERAVQSQLPEAWEDAGMSADEWASLQPARASVKRANAEYAAGAAAAADKYRETLDKLARTRDAAIAAVAGPLARAVMGGIDQLSLDARVLVESGPPETRDERLKQQLALARAQWVANARAGAEDPFRA